MQYARHSKQFAETPPFLHYQPLAAPLRECASRQRHASTHGGLQTSVRFPIIGPYRKHVGNRYPARGWFGESRDRF